VALKYQVDLTILQRNSLQITNCNVPFN